MKRVVQNIDIPVIGSASISAPVWVEYINNVNLLLGTATALVGLLYVSCRLYYLIKSEGKLK